LAAIFKEAEGIKQKSAVLLNRHGTTEAAVC
jgi:hypothetical protein